MSRPLLVRPAFAVARQFRHWLLQALGWRRFWTRYRRYKAAAPPGRRPSTREMIPCLLDDTAETPVDPTYFFQDAWAFEKIVSASPTRHVDVGSHHKFVSLLAQVVPTTMVDIRPLPVDLWNLDFRAGSVLQLPFEDGELKSVSSLCVVEHIGLGRYGDPIDPFGTEKALAELKRVVAPDGDLYVSMPVDDETRVYFDAHRAFKEADLLDMFRPFSVVERRYIYGYRFQENVSSGFGTGCYHLRPPN